MKRREKIVSGNILITLEKKQGKWCVDTIGLEFPSSIMFALKSSALEEFKKICERYEGPDAHKKGRLPQKSSKTYKGSVVYKPAKNPRN